MGHVVEEFLEDETPMKSVIQQSQLVLNLDIGKGQGPFEIFRDKAFLFPKFGPARLDGSK